MPRTSLAVPARPGRSALRLALLSLLLLGLLPVFGCGTGGNGTSSTGSTGGTSSAGATPALSVSDTVGPYRHTAALSEVQSAIERQGAQWTADETEISESNASLDDRAEVNGDLESTADSEASRNRAAPTARATLKSINWRSKDGVDWTTPAKSQGDYGTCVAFAAIGAFEANIKIAKGDSALAPILSDWCLWCEGTDKQNPKPGGWKSGDAATWLKDKGTVKMSDCRYAPADFSLFTSPGSTVTRYKISSYKWVAGAEGIKTALASGPVVGSMQVYRDFDYFYAGGIYEHVVTGNPQIDQPDTTYPIGHAILIVGYDDDNKYWICKNSNGPNWGEFGGFCRLKYGAVGGITEEGCYQYTVDKTITYP